MKFLSFCLSLSLVAFASAAEDDHDHESCACAAEKDGFVIDCMDQQAMLDAIAALGANGCETDCENVICHTNFFILQSHHDYCLEAEVPEAVEDSLHIYEDGCDSCEILKKVDPGLADCPPHNCQDTSGSTAFTAMINAGCLNDCSTAFCSSNYKTLKAVHDLCEEDDLSTAAELGFHDFSEACSAESCNVGDAELELEQLICTEGGDGDFIGGITLCFSGSSTVLVEDGTLITMNDLKIGDRVQVSTDGKFDTVYSFGHYEPDALSEYLRIQSQNKGAIEISAQHMLFLDNNKAVPAASVRVGDMLLGGNAVTKINHVMSKGAFAPFTNSGTIVVNKIVASNYVSLTGRTTFLGLDMHLAAHMAVAPRRILCQIGMCEEQYTAEGTATWIPIQAATFVAAQEVAIAALVAAAVAWIAVVRRQKAI